MLLGKDTTNSNFLFEEQPGNQIAGIDASYKFLKNKNKRIYFQYIGEDGLDPIIDDRWIGAIFPSKRFGLSGIQYISPNNSYPWSINLEHVNTDSGYKNVTYNHSIYQSGYRYKSFPIGASIDADSHETSLKINKYFENHSINLKYQKMNINQNMNNLRWGADNIINEQVTLKITKKLKNNINLDMIFLNRNFDKLYDFKNNIFLLNIELIL